MKKLILGVAVCFCSVATFAQDKKEVKKEIKKEVNLEDNNGEKTLTITTDEDGKVTKEVYTGAEAEQKMQELRDEHGVVASAEMKEESVEKEVRMEEVDGEKVLTITTKKNGEEEVEVYKGEEAEAKLKELEESTPMMKQEKKRVIIQEEKISKSRM